MANKELFYRIANIIEEDPSRHNQSSWMDDVYKASADNTVEVEGAEVSCGTTHCVAGWAWALSGHAQELADFMNLKYSAHDSSGISTHTIVEKAACALGISWREANHLFYTMDTNGYDWPSMLRAIGDGMSVEDAKEKFEF